jgi:hypothetical protein
MTWADRLSAPTGHAMSCPGVVAAQRSLTPAAELAQAKRPCYWYLGLSALLIRGRAMLNVLVTAVTICAHYLADRWEGQR